MDSQQISLPVERNVSEAGRDSADPLASIRIPNDDVALRYGGRGDERPVAADGDNARPRVTRREQAASLGHEIDNSKLLPTANRDLGEL